MSELNLSSNGNPNFNITTNSNYYSSKIKEGIPIFQEQNGGNLYNNYIDPFKILENEKNNNIYNVGINNYNMNVSDIQTRKIFEKEMNPYLLRMKNELNLIIEKFRKKINEKNQYINDILEIKNEIIKNKQNSEENYLNIDQKILNINDNLNFQENKLNNLQSEFLQINHMGKKNEELFLKNELENIKNRLDALDDNNDKYLKEIVENIERKIENKLEIMNQNINFLKEDNKNIKRDLSQNIIKLDIINSENNKKNEKFNEINSEFNDISNQINNMKINNNKIMNLINDLEIGNNDCQQKIKNLNDKINSINENIESINYEFKNQKENINLNKKYLSELENNLNMFENEKSSINNKLIELNIKLENQEQFFSKNNNNMNNVQNENNNLLYKDISAQITKTKKILDEMREKSDKEIGEIKNTMNQFELVLKNNPFLTMNETERISILFKKEQVKFNETFRQQLKLLNEEVKNLKSISQFDKTNLEIINKNFKKHTKDIDMLEQSLKSWTQIAQVLTKNYDKIKKDKFNDDKSSNNNFNNNIIFEDNLNKIQKYINNNKSDVYNLQLNIKEINEKTIPQIYKYIDDQLKIKPTGNAINENIISTKNNFGKINNNFNLANKEDNIIKNNINTNNNDINNIYINNNIDSIKNKNLDDLASKIELMGNESQKKNLKLNDINNKDDDNKFMINSDFSHSLSDNLNNKKDDDMDYIDKLIKGKDNNNSKSKNDEFDSDFDK